MQQRRFKKILLWYFKITAEAFYIKNTHLNYARKIIKI